MFSITLKQQAVPLAFLGLLLLVAVVTAVADQRLKQERMTFSIETYERLMHRIDVAVSSISDTMIEEGMAADFEELMNRTPSSDGPAAPGTPDRNMPRVPLDMTGIIWHPKVPLAVVNGALVGVGDHVGDAEIIKVEKLHVAIRYRDGVERVLKLVDADER
jgi:hypothetical protein